MVDIAFGIDNLDGLILARGSDLPSQAVLSPGGSAANTATWLARCGMDVSLIGALGSDPLGDYLIKEIGTSNVRVVAERLPNALTGICLILNENDGERTMIPSAGANAYFDVSGLLEQLEIVQVTHVHVSAYMLFHEMSGSTALAYIQSARDRGASVSLDPASSALLSFNRERIFKALALTDLLLANADEARELSRLLGNEANAIEDIDLELISTALHPRSPLVVITNGSLPVRALGDSIHNFTSPVVKIQDVASTTGAGDAFNAGFLNAWLAGGDIPTSLAAGTSLATRVLGQVGATTLTDQ
jgi:ribokinase